MKTYYVKANRNQQVRSLLAFKGESEDIRFDFSPWEDDNGTVTSVVWTVQSGQASVSNEALASSVASADVSNSEAGSSFIKIVATAGNNIIRLNLRVVSKDPEQRINDYGICG